MLQTGGIVSGPIDPSLINKDSEFVFSEDPTHPMSQPSLFKGTLKSYQIKGVNWLINLYNQVNFQSQLH
jgi:SNF2 family DNA or RNA helicase